MGAFYGVLRISYRNTGAGSSFIMQVKYPHEALLVKQTAQHLANFLLGFILNIIILVAFGVIPSWKIAFFPVIILPLFFSERVLGL
jgi:ABC-type polysaccharide/polyol phosphate export permease